MEFNKYNYSKIYRLFCLTTGKEYIGSTTKKLISTRLSYHKSDYKRFINGRYKYVSSFGIISGNNYDIELIENYNCATKRELLEREKIYIIESRNRGNNINMKLPC
jgi:hypothetical protein